MTNICFNSGGKFKLSLDNICLDLLEVVPLLPLVLFVVDVEADFCFLLLLVPAVAPLVVVADEDLRLFDSFYSYY